MTIILNAARCKLCGTLIKSRSIHDYVTCTCGAIAVDGGTAYLKRSGDPKDMIELSISPDYMEALAHVIYQWTYDGDDGPIWFDCLDTIEEVGKDFVLGLIYLWLIKNKIFIYDPEVFLDPDIEFLSWDWFDSPMDKLEQVLIQ